MLHDLAGTYVRSLKAPEQIFKLETAGYFDERKNISIVGLDKDANSDHQGPGASETIFPVL